MKVSSAAMAPEGPEGEVLSLTLYFMVTLARERKFQIYLETPIYAEKSHQCETNLVYFHTQRLSFSEWLNTYQKLPRYCAK